LEQWRASEEPPAQILPQVLERNSNALAQQFVPSDPDLWTVENFPKFLDLRRQMIANAINSYLASLIEEKIPERVFPQIAQIPDPAIAAEAHRAVDKLTIEDVDTGLFMLGRLFENTLEGYIRLGFQEGMFKTAPTNYMLASMIDWTKANGLISDSTALHFLRVKRNEPVHEILSPDERQAVFNNAGWLAGMYLDYTLLFARKIEELKAKPNSAETLLSS
jgi:hypothetical protein